MNNVLRTRQRLLALALPLTAALYIGAEGLDPKGTDESSRQRPSHSRCFPSQRSTRHSSMFRARSPSLRSGESQSRMRRLPRWSESVVRRTATIATLIGAIGAFCGAIVNVFVGLNLAAAATAHVHARGGCADPDGELQFSTRSGLHRPLRLQRIVRAGRHGSRPLAKPNRPALARRPLRRRLRARRADGIGRCAPGSSCRWRCLRLRWSFLQCGSGRNPLSQ